MMPTPFKRVPPETLELSVNFAPDGTYPARLLTNSKSIWLLEGMKQELASGVFAVCEQGRCYLFQEDYNERSGVLINGQPHLDRIKLQDGDFIQIKKHKTVFQADPAGDKRKAWEAEINAKPIP